MALGGILPERLMTMDEVEEAAFDGEFAEVIDVAEGDLRTEMVALWSEGEYAIPSTDATERTCSRSHPRHKIALLISAADAHTATNLLVPEWVYLICRDGVVVILSDSDAIRPMVQQHYSSGLWNIHLKPDPTHTTNQPDQYRWHPDQNQSYSQPPHADYQATLGTLNRNICHQDNRNCFVSGAVGQTYPLIAGGLPSGANIQYDGLTGHNPDEASTQPVIFYHNSANSTRPGKVTVKRFQSPDRTASIIVATAHANGALSELVLEDCDAHSVSVGVTQGLGTADLPLPTNAEDRIKWRVRGACPAIDVSSGTGSAEVAATTPGVAVSGDGADRLFGLHDDGENVDYRGYGRKLVMEESDGLSGAGGDRSLGAILGDRTGDNEDIVVGAETATLDLDYRAMTESAILAAINADLPTNPISIVDIGPEIIVSPHQTRLAWNDSGATMTRGVLLAWSGAKTVEPATAGAARVDAVGMRRHPDGERSEVSVAGAIGSTMIPEVGATTGEFGVGASGRLSFAATPKVGRVLAGVVEFYR
jgi:hypothetical protein